MPKKKSRPEWVSWYPGQSLRYQTIAPLADMTIEQLKALQEELNFEFSLRERIRDLAAPFAAKSPQEGK